MRTEPKDIHYAFQLSRKIIFEVDYYRLENNQNKRFSTSAAQFNQPKTNYNHCGQAQDTLLPEFSEAYAFFKKWDALHLKELNHDLYEELLKDIAGLKETYNYLAIVDNVTSNHIELGFHEIKELSKMKVKINK